MNLIKTISFKLKADAAKLLPTITAYTNSFNHVCQFGFQEKKFNPIFLHNSTYSNCRTLFGLPSQLTCSSRNKASEVLKRSLKSKNKFEKCPNSKRQSIRYDARSYSVFLSTNEVSLSTTSGRQTFPIVVSKYHEEYITNWKRGSADLIIRKNNEVYLNVTFMKDISDQVQNGNFIGLDRGIKNIAVTSDNKFYTGKHVLRVSGKYKSLRSRLQAVGTKSAKRHLRKLSGKERRFKADTNHCISKNIIQKMQPGDTLVLEDLKGIRAQRLRKTVRTLIAGWSFYQLEMFLQYKADAKGISIVKEKAHYTSQKCSCCGYTARNNRKTQGRFECKSCGYCINADLNAGRNIRNLGLLSYMESNRAVVNQPIVSV